MNITTKEEAKKAASGVRRELKALGKAPGDLKHGDILDVMAKAFGYNGWNEWSTLLVDGSAPGKVASTVAANLPAQRPWGGRYPLVNNGEFDFTGPGDRGYAFESFLTMLHGIRDRIPAMQEVISATRVDGQSLHVDWVGNTRLNWDEQKHEVDVDGFVVWENVDMEVPQSRMVLVPVSVVERNGGTDDFDAYSCDELLVREALLKEFESYAVEHDMVGQIAALEPDGSRVTKEPINNIESVLRFGLTAKEENALIVRMRSLLK